MIHTNKKAAGAINTNGPHTDTNSADFRNYRLIQQVHEGKDIATARLALASEINQAHANAVRHAGTAIDFAKHAGELLLQVKAELKHGEFIPWLAANCDVSDRQARRYMAAALGKPVPMRVLKTDTVSDLPAIEITMRSVGLVEWQDPQGNNLLFEIHAFVFPDGVTLGYRSAYIVFGKNEHDGAFTEYDKRGVNAKYFSVRDHAKRWDVPLEKLTVIDDCEPSLWTFMHDWDVLEAMRQDWVKADAVKAVRHE